MWRGEDMQMCKCNTEPCCILVAFTEGLYTCTLWIVKSTDPRGMLKFLRITISHSTIQTQRQDSVSCVWWNCTRGRRVCTTYWGKNIKYSFLIMSTFPRETMQPYIPFRSIISAHILQCLNISCRFSPKIRKEVEKVQRYCQSLMCPNWHLRKMLSCWYCWTEYKDLYYKSLAEYHKKN